MPEHKHKHEHEHGVATTATSPAHHANAHWIRRVAEVGSRRWPCCKGASGVLATDPYPHHGSAIHASGNGVTAVFHEDSVIPDLDND